MEIKINYGALEKAVIELNESGYTVTSSQKKNNDVILQFRERVIIREVPRIPVKQPIRIPKRQIRNEIASFAKDFFAGLKHVGDALCLGM